MLAAIVLASTVLETLLARLRATPGAFPDEYLYSALARSLATTGHLRVLGVSARFPALLEPVLTAPLWLVHDVGTAYRLVQLENAFVMSLAAVPADLIARRLAVGTTAALGVAAFAAVGPEFRFVSMLQSEPFAYPLALALAAATLAAVERPSLRAQSLVLVLSALVTLARIQLAVLPLCAVAVVVVVALRERRLRSAFREQGLLLGVVGVCLSAGLAVALLRGFGFYHLAPAAAGVGTALRVAGVDAYVVVLGTGVAIVPSAFVGIALALTRPRSRGELAFGVLLVTTVAALLGQSVVWGDVRLVQERYLCYLLPLLGIAFALRCSRTRRWMLAEVGVAAAVAAVAPLIPLSGYAIDALRNESPVLYAFDRLFLAWHSLSGVSGVFALAATLLAVVGTLASRRRGEPFVLGLSVAVAAALLVAGASYAGRMNRIARSVYLPPDAAWVDHAARGDATMLVEPGARRDSALATLFWNPSLTRVVRLPGAASPDELAQPEVRIDGRGVLLLGGKPLTEPLLVDDNSSTVAFRAASPLARWGTETLWRPHSPARLRVVLVGRLSDGRLLPGGTIAVWGLRVRLAGWIELRLRAPTTLGRAHLRLSAGSGVITAFSVRAGRTRIIRVRACGASPWRSKYQAGPMKTVGGRVALPVVSIPRYVPDPAACG